MARRRDDQTGGVFLDRGCGAAQPIIQEDRGRARGGGGGRFLQVEVHWVQCANLLSWWNSRSVAAAASLRHSRGPVLVGGLRQM